MNLIVISKHYGHFSGASLATCELLRRWCSHFDRIDVICAADWYRPKETPSCGQIEVHALSRFTIATVWRRVRRLKRPQTAVYGVDDYGFLGKLAGMPFLMANHSNWPYAMRAGGAYFLKGLIHTPLYALNFWAANHVVNSSKFGERWAGRFAKNSSLARTGISLRQQGKAPTMAHPNIMTLGKMDSRKGALLEKIIDGLHAQEKVTSWHLYLVGPITYEPLRERIDSKRVVSCGRVDNPGDYLAQCDIFLLASRMENLSLAVTEAMSLGKPVVCFDVGGMGEVVHERTGYLIPRFDVDAAVSALVTLLADPVRRGELGAQAREEIAPFDWDLSAEIYLQAFDEIISGH